jgi:hypothetical protein
MEIREYIREYRRTKRRWLLLLVALPIVAGLAAGAMLAVEPAKSTATVHVRVPSAHAIGDSQIGLYIARLSEGLTLPSVRRQIMAESPVPLADLRSLTVERQAQSDQFVVTLTTTIGNDRTLATAITAAKVGTLWVARQDTGRIDAALRAAQAAYDEAQAALFAYQDEIGDLDPVGTYATVSRSMIAPSPNVSIAALRAQQAALVAQVRRFTQLRDAVNIANSHLGAARAASTNQQAQVTTSESGELILDSQVVRRSTIQPVIEGAALAAVVAFLLVLGLSLLPDLIRRQRTQTSTTQTSTTQTSTAQASTAEPAPGTDDAERDPPVDAGRQEHPEPMVTPVDAATPSSSDEPSEDRVPVGRPSSVPSA